MSIFSVLLLVATALTTSASFAADIKHIDDIPQYCLELALQLDNQPFFKGEGAAAEKCKVIPLQNYRDANICSRLSDNSRQIVGEEVAWYIHSFGIGNYRLFENGIEIPYGLELSIYDELPRCSSKVLKSSYDEIIRKIKEGWTRTEIKNYPDILHKKNTDEYSLFVKDSSLIDEANLIGSFAYKFNINNNLNIHDEWLTYPGFEHRKKIYLWIRTSVLSETIKMFDLKITD